MNKAVEKAQEVRKMGSTLGNIDAIVIGQSTNHPNQHSRGAERSRIRRAGLGWGVRLQEFRRANCLKKVIAAEVRRKGDTRLFS